MNRDEARKAAEVMLAYADGAEIQEAPRPYTKSKYAWSDCDDPVFDWDCMSYRIKPKPREFWVDPRTMNAYPFKPDLVVAKPIRVREVLDD